MIIRWEIRLGLLLLLISIAIGSRKDETVTPLQKCPMLTECPARAEPCSLDEDCSVDSVCCSSPCGKVCTKQLFTGCQTMRLAASRRAKALGVDVKQVRMPRCTKSGGFEPIQCDNEITPSCWCVDDTGFELAGTRAPAVSLVNCTARKPCADHTCRMFCPHGFALTKDGCPMCRCRDPCDDIKCPNALECHLEELACADPPCPPIPTCKKGRSLDSICPYGDPLRISDTVRPFLCGTDPGKPTCPPLYQCLVQKGNDYGVCCGASIEINKPGTCPTISPHPDDPPCGTPCSYDIGCPSVQKCCKTDQCDQPTCMHPTNVTECLHQKALSDMLTVNERAGRGYSPQCTETGQFESKQCSRNNLVCWCVDRMGRKIRGTMGPAETIQNCAIIDKMNAIVSARSYQCPVHECAAICEYGFKLAEDGCPTCECDDPCAGYPCPEDEECVNVKEASCAGDILCPTLPVCRPKAVYANPCEAGAPLTDDISGAPVACELRTADGVTCPKQFECTAVAGSTQSVCCPVAPSTTDLNTIQQQSDNSGRPQTMCEYLHDFSDSMEGTRDGMRLALPTPNCTLSGDYAAKQCDSATGDCWCVDHFGTEIPDTRNTHRDCNELREEKECLDLTCRMGCEYGFVLEKETGCPLCQCRDPCSGVNCGSEEQCQLVEVSCRDHYCPPVPACLPRKAGQCPYLMPASAPTCDFKCTSDTTCNGTERCCSNGCGTQCLEPLHLTACQHERTLALHQVHENGLPANKVYLPSCEPDGSYSSRQCHPGMGICWCVDNRGFEKSKTRHKIKVSNYTCTDNATNTHGECPQFKCSVDCEHGYELDDKHCRTCKCIDPCSKVQCKGDGEQCRLVTVECTNWPCPPVPICLPRKENPCQNGGQPLRIPPEEGEIVVCGPEFETCPSSHKCQLSPVGEYAVCCPKPRSVCFEPLNTGDCSTVGNEDDMYLTTNETRYYFNARSNRCEPFVHQGCGGNHNNFHNAETCKAVCPVLSQCERLREKNQITAERLKKPNFMPKCDSVGNWEAVQCLDHVGVCWCVTPKGHPLKGTLTRGDTKPQCNFRQARRRSDNDDDLDFSQKMYPEQFLVHLTSTDKEDILYPIPERTRCQALGGQCDENGRFLPTQCDTVSGTCWCVDESGNQLKHTSTFPIDNSTKPTGGQCQITPVESTEVRLGFRAHFQDDTSSQLASLAAVEQLTSLLNAMGGQLGPKGIIVDARTHSIALVFQLSGNNQVDTAYRLERMAFGETAGWLAGLKPDLASTAVHHEVVQPPPKPTSDVIFERREIVSQAPVSQLAPYYTVMIVVAASVAFTLSILALLVVWYRRKTGFYYYGDNSKLASVFGGCNAAEKNPVEINSRPIYIELPPEQQSH